MAKNQAEALATFAASARNDGQKPKDIGLHAQSPGDSVSAGQSKPRTLSNPAKAG